MGKITALSSEFILRKSILVMSALVCSCIASFGQARLVTRTSSHGIDVEFIRDEVHPVDTVSVTIVGDVMMHMAQIENCLLGHSSRDPGDPSAYDFTPCLAGIGDILKDADICIANMEFTHAGAPYRGYPFFSAPDSFSTYLADCGVDVFLMANNHILDFGAAGALRTIEVYDALRDRGVRRTGCFADEESLREGWPLILRCGGLRIGIVNFTYGTNNPQRTEWPKVILTDREEIAAALRTARDSADVVIAIPHWGEEYSLRHSAVQGELADFLIRHGADAVVGSHPHVVQDTEIRDRFPDRKVPVVYSLGNIISNMSAANTQIGLIVTLPVVRYSDGSARIGEPQYTLTWCSLPGGLSDRHVTVPVRDQIGRRSEWRGPGDYDRMVETYNRIKSTSGIQE